MPADDNNITTTSSTTTTTIPIIAATDASIPERHDAVGWIGPQDGTILAKLEAPDGASFLVTKRQVVIGRESTHSDTDVPVADTNYVSRGHLVLNCRDDGVWTIICNGKNGVFVNNQLVKKATEPCPIPKICHLRFPSTSVRVGFQSLAGPAPATSANHRIQDVAKNANDSGFVSPSDLVCPVSAAVISPPSLLFVRKEEPVAMVSASTTKLEDLSDGDDTCGGGESVCTTGKPPYSYAQLIVQAIDSTSDKQMTLSGIYAYITKCYPWYRTSDKGWQNSIRHNLSLNRYFLKVPRSQEEPGKGSFWRLDPTSQAKLLQFAFRKRRQRGSSGSNGCLGTKGVRSAPVSPSLDGGSKSDGELHDVFPGDINDTKPGCALTPPLCQSAPILIVPNDPKPSSSMVSPNTDHHHHSAYSPSSNTNATPLLNDVVPVKALVNTINKESSKQAVFRFSPIDTEVSSSGNCSRFIQSAPCSPKGFKEGYPKREHHHSGGPFRVRTSVKDGRHRLQLCHSPPEYVPVSHPDVSALQMLSNQQNRKLSKTLLQHYRGGSQSLSTTPVREILSGGGRLLQEDRIAKALLDASPEPKVLKRRLQQQAQATIDQQHHSDGNNGFTQPSASTIAALSSSNLHAVIQAQQQQQQQLVQQAYSNQLTAAGYLNSTTTTWLQNAVASLYQGATPGAAASLFNIGGNHRGGVALVGVHHPTLMSVDSARLLAAAIGGVGGDSDNSSASMPKVARTE